MPRGNTPVKSTTADHVQRSQMDRASGVTHAGIASPNGEISEHCFVKPVDEASEWSYCGVQVRRMDPSRRHIVAALAPGSKLSTV
jgi:hypothetical protein